jgi:hypothetical protein
LYRYVSCHRLHGFLDLFIHLRASHGKAGMFWCHSSSRTNESETRRCGSRCGGWKSPVAVVWPSRFQVVRRLARRRWLAVDGEAELGSGAIGQAPYSDLSRQCVLHPVFLKAKSISDHQLTRDSPCTRAVLSSTSSLIPQILLCRIMVSSGVRTGVTVRADARFPADLCGVPVVCAIISSFLSLVHVTFEISLRRSGSGPSTK